MRHFRNNFADMPKAARARGRLLL